MGLSSSFLLACSLLLPSSLLHAAEVDFKGAKIEYSGGTYERPDGEEGDIVFIFKNAAAVGTIKFPGLASGSVLVVGGGGAGGSVNKVGNSYGAGGGGGAGGFVTVDGLMFEPESTYSIFVGAGGVAGELGDCGGNGDESAIKLGDDDYIVRAYGGGGGGAASDGRGNGTDGTLASGGGGSLDGDTATPHNGGAGLEGQGKKGGDATKQRSGGGGGGADGEGATATTNNYGGDGGAGKASSITGKELYYAAGGGGGVRSGTHPGKGGSEDAEAERRVGGDGGTSTAATPGMDGRGGGGGGGTQTAPGANGGSGVVIIRISSALAGPLLPPVGPSFTYNGENRIAANASPWLQFVGVGEGLNQTNATDVGDYYFTVKPAEGMTWDKSIGGGTYETNVTWKIIPKEIERPVVPTLSYSGENQVAISNPDEALTFPGVGEGLNQTNAVNAGGYFYALALKSNNYVWKGAEVGHERDVLTNDWTIAAFAVETPVAKDSKTGSSSIFYTGEDHVVLFPSKYYTYTEDSVTNATEGGTYEFTAVLVNPANVTNYVWKGYPAATRAEPYHGTWRISPASNRITEFSILGWKSTGEPNDPVCKAIWGEETAQYRWMSTLGGEEWTEWFPRAEWKALAPRETGAYKLQAIITASSNWEATDARELTFTLWDNPESFFADHMPVTLTSTSAMDIQNLKFTLALAEDNPKGFSYSRIETKADLAVILLDDFDHPEDGTPVPFEMTKWDTRGDSELTVVVPKVPANGTVKLIVYWALKPGLIAPIPPSVTGPTPATSTKVTVTHGLVVRNGEVMNYWEEYPELSKSYWDEGTDPGELIAKAGRLAFGGVTNYFYDVAHPETTYSDWRGLTAAGSYRAVFDSVEPEKYTPLTYTIDFRIVQHKSYADLGDSQSGRVLLMNNDKGDADHPEVTYQGYYHLSTRSKTTDTFWELLNDEPVSVFNLKAGTECVLWTANYGRRLWHLIDCRHGNNFPAGSDTSALSGSANYLNWSPTSVRISSGTMSVRRRDVGQLVMRNVENAAVYSSCFTNGIGTIYFDAVNSRVPSAVILPEHFRLRVEFATNCVEIVEGERVPVAKPPTDENVVEVVTNISEGAMVISTNRYGLANWQTAEIVPYLRDGTDDFVRLAPAKFVDLGVQNGGTVNNFYRMLLELRISGPVRFRIVRETCVPSSIMSVDEDGFILLDNIIVSEPPLWAQLATTGVYDEEKSGKQTLGFEGAFNVPYPSVRDELYARGVPEGPLTDPAALGQMIAAAKMHYRWRYRSQRFEPAKDGAKDRWYSVDLVPSQNFKAMRPLDLPKLPGDVEFWYEMNLEAPFYKYVDYSGYAFGVPGYTEEISAVTNRASGYNYPTGGTDWFVRLREGRDDYSLVKAIARPAGNTNASAQVEVRMELLTDRVWRGYLQTLDPVAGGVWEYRFEGLGRWLAGDSVPGGVNRWIADHDYTMMPVSCKIKEAGEGEWAKMPSLSKTGYYMFQLDDESMSASVVHADYMNFNGWNDAKGTVYVGNSTEDAKKSGVSPKMRTYDEPFKGWTGTPSSNQLWQERFTDGAWPGAEKPDFRISNYNGYPLNKTFASAMTLNGWTVGQGQFVSGHYQDRRTQSGVALQMEGQGKGYIQLVGAPEAPRGLESLSFMARIAQAVQFEDFACYFGGNIAAMKDYTLVTRASFDRNSNRNFSGNASLSLVADYFPFKGCYEARWEQLEGEWNGSGVCTGIRKRSQRLCLYRWNNTKPTLLTAITNTVFDVQSTDGTDSAKYQPFYISVESLATGTRIMAGVRRSGMTLTDPDGNYGSANWFSVSYLDSSSARMTSGTFGVLSANCPGVFAKPETYSEPVTYQTGDLRDKSVTFNGEVKNLRQDVDDGAWAYDPDRMAYDAPAAQADYRYAFVGKAPEQTICIYLAPAGTTSFPDTPTKTVTVSGFGTYDKPGKSYKLDLWEPEDRTVKFATGGTIDDVRTDVVIDNIEMRQWRGDNYGSRDTVDFIVPDDGYNWRTNFIFTTAWITNGAVRLSAKRARTSDVASLRSPLLDGGGNPARGVGLGMISVQYRNAQANASLDLQIATNVTGTAKVDESRWITVTNWNFATMTSTQRANGLLSVYLGLHGVQGLMRVRVATNVIAAVKTVTDPSRFGEVEVTRIFCRDEPDIDLTCWWGWNLRTTDEDSRAYLPDKTLDPREAGLSLSLNNSASKDVIAIEKESYKQHMPFVQTPTFGSDIVGEVTFRARKDDLSPSSQLAEIAVYGAKSGSISLDSEWKLLERFVISNTTYTTYSCRTAAGDNYRAFRFGVTGVPDVNASSRGPSPTQGSTPVRVMIDEVVVSQAIRPVMGFKYIYPFRNHLSDNVKIEDILSCDEQPLLGESWSVQAEIEVRQLPDEIDLKTPGREPRVYFHWFPAMTPWGRDNWEGRVGANVAELVRADGEKMVFRGGFAAAPRAVAEPLMDGSFAVAQYSADVVYWNTSGQCLTNSLSEAEWTRPFWYDPLNLNAKYAAWKSFAAYTILEGVAPKRTWINEVNLFDGLDTGGSATGGDNQYIEVAAPMSQAIDGWYLEYISNSGVTNVLCSFGLNGVSSVKTMNSTNEYVFFSVQSPRTRDAKTLDVSKGEVDGTWSNFDGNGGAFESTLPIGLRLIRPSGIVEQEIVLEGTNAWHDSRYEARYSATNMVARQNAEAAATGGDQVWYLAGNEYRSTVADSLGVIEGIGATQDEWKSPMLKTPGRVNVGQNVPLDYVIYPNGALMMIYSYLDGSGHVRQTFGDIVEADADAMAVARKGGEGTNITYFIDQWWEVKELATNGVPVPGWTGRTDMQRFTAGVGQSNNVSVTMSVQPRADIRELIGDGNRYEAAILDWLGKGRTMKGEFENPGEIQLGEYWPYLQDPKFRGRRKLSLTEEYWLDIDPTSSNWVLHAGFANGTDMLPHEVPMPAPRRPAIRMGIYMAITNVNETSPKYGQNWSPYMLRGLTPGETSLDYSETSPNSWTSVTFKVTGDIQNNMPLRKRWVPMRWFTFHEGSFAPDHTAVIDIFNPYDSDSAGAAIGWLDYIGCQVFYSWSIDTRLNPITVEILAPENKLAE